MARYKLTPRAKFHLRQISGYSCERWGARQRDKYIRLLYERFRWLSNNPQLGKHRNDIKEGFYCYPEGKHRIFYLKHSKHISIIGVFHEHADVAADLG